MVPMYFVQIYQPTDRLGLIEYYSMDSALQLASLVDVPTPAVINGTVVLFDTTISSAAESAATSS